MFFKWKWISSTPQNTHIYTHTLTGASWTDECVQHHVPGHPASDAEPGLTCAFHRDGDSSLWLGLESHLSYTHRLQTWLGLVFWDSRTIVMFSFLGVLILRKLKRLTSLMWFLSFFHGNHVTILFIRCTTHALLPRMTTMATSGTPAVAAVPFVITFGYKNFKQDGTNKRSADFKVCSTRSKDAGSTTSNFIRLLKTHPDRSVTSAHMALSLLLAL